MTERKFKTEVQQLLDLVIHSLYSNKDIFLRELVANAADAIDKARFAALTKPELAHEWQIRITPNRKNNTLTISDNGIGMTQEELVENIGTIAKSGTKEFLSNLQKEGAANTPDLIGQFGVGFYSSFMVADKVELITKRAGSEAPALRWESSGQDSYSIDEVPDQHEAGTTITLHLKNEAKAYVEDWKIREIVKKYSDFIAYPITLVSTKTGDANETKTEESIINSQKAIWLRSPEELTEEDHKNFFSHLSPFGGDPLTHIHFSAEGTSEFKALLYIPSKAPFDLFTPEQNKKGLHLYVRRVFITDDCPQLIPDYLRFLKGVVDSSDLPLNVSRELLQENAKILKIQKNLVRKTLAELQKLLEQSRDKYLGFFREFGRILKEGVHTDHANIEKLRDLLLFETMNKPAGELVSLKEYSAAMPAAQKEIYCAVGDSRAALENSPHLEILRSRGFDVLFMTDPIDEWILGSLTEYDGKKIKAANKGEIELDDETKKLAEEKKQKAAETHKTLVECLKKELADKVKDVRFSDRLTDSACCLVSDSEAPSPHMERVLKALHQNVPAYKRTLELNPEHPLLASLQKVYDKNSTDSRLKEYAELLYDQALLTEGSPIPDPLKFSKSVASLMVKGLEESDAK